MGIAVVSSAILTAPGNPANGLQPADGSGVDFAAFLGQQLAALGGKDALLGSMLPSLADRASGKPLRDGKAGDESQAAIDPASVFLAAGWPLAITPPPTAAAGAALQGIAAQAAADEKAGGGNDKILPGDIGRGAESALPLPLATAEQALHPDYASSNPAGRETTPAAAWERAFQRVSAQGLIDPQATPVETALPGMQAMAAPAALTGAQAMAAETGLPEAQALTAGMFLSRPNAALGEKALPGPTAKPVDPRGEAAAENSLAANFLQAAIAPNFASAVSLASGKPAANAEAAALPGALDAPRTDIAQILRNASSEFGKGVAAANPLQAEVANIAADPHPSAGNNGLDFAATLATQTAAAHSAQRPPEPAATTLQLATPIHDNRWAQDLGEKVAWLVKNDQQTAQIHINPPQLGPMQITLSLNGDQASAMFVSPHAEVRQALTDAVPQLREMLAGAGINLGQANVGAQLPQQNNQTPHQFSKPSRSNNDNAILGADNVQGTASLPTAARGGRGMVDLFA